MGDEMTAQEKALHDILIIANDNHGKIPRTIEKIAVDGLVATEDGRRILAKLQGTEAVSKLHVSISAALKDAEAAPSSNISGGPKDVGRKPHDGNYIQLSG